METKIVKMKRKHLLFKEAVLKITFREFKLFHNQIKVPSPA